MWIWSPVNLIQIVRKEPIHNKMKTLNTWKIQSMQAFCNVNSSKMTFLLSLLLPNVEFHHNACNIIVTSSNKPYSPQLALGGLWFNSGFRYPITYEFQMNRSSITRLKYFKLALKIYSLFIFNLNLIGHHVFLSCNPTQGISI